MLPSDSEWMLVFVFLLGPVGALACLGLAIAARRVGRTWSPRLRLLLFGGSGLVMVGPLWTAVHTVRMRILFSDLGALFAGAELVALLVLGAALLAPPTRAPPAP